MASGAAREPAPLSGRGRKKITSTLRGGGVGKIRAAQVPKGVRHFFQGAGDGGRMYGRGSPVQAGRRKLTVGGTD